MKQTHSEGIQNWLKLIRADGVGPTLFHRLISHLGSVEDVLQASIQQLTRVEGIGDKTAQRIHATRDDFDVNAELAMAEKHGVWIIHCKDGRYPAPLRAIYDPPPVLYVKGTLARSDSLSVAIVGSRRCTTYGQEQASRFGHILASAGFTIVSGMARGIDTAAHHGALAAGGRTIAVQGCGLTRIFPPENEELFCRIATSGACISELPLAYEPLSENFPGRNRIIAGLSMAVLVVEASAKSGALLTARAALDSDRDVMAVPGKIDSPFSQGSHRLIKDGARLVDSIDDIMETLGPVGETLSEHAATHAEKAKRKNETPLFDPANFNLSPVEIAVYNSLDGQPRHVEEIVADTQLEPGKVNAALISLRLKGLIKQLPGNVFLK
ncbi:MAG: DNA-processing protein DprA [Sedimentisphaerales bacterium]|nr:DNA-processing protein DprA [Sedimentisphaerales bacterium]